MIRWMSNDMPITLGWRTIPRIWTASASGICSIASQRGSSNSAHNSRTQNTSFISHPLASSVNFRDHFGFFARQPLHDRFNGVVIPPSDDDRYRQVPCLLQSPKSGCRQAKCFNSEFIFRNQFHLGHVCLHWTESNNQISDVSGQFCFIPCVSMQQ